MSDPKDSNNDSIPDGEFQLVANTTETNLLVVDNIKDKLVSTAALCHIKKSNGVTTTIEALWKNVPVLTKAGYNFNSRCGESILKNANIDDFIATSNEDYINKAVFYANNIDKLDDVRKKIFDEIEKSSLFDTKGFSVDFCRALNDMIVDVNRNYK